MSCQDASVKAFIEPVERITGPAVRSFINGSGNHLKGEILGHRARTERRIVDGSLTIEVGPEVETCLVHVAGELDIAAASALEDELDRLLSSDLKGVILDLGELLFIDSTGLQCLLQVTRRSRADGDRLRMRGANGEVDGLLRFTGIREVLPMIG